MLTPPCRAGIGPLNDFSMKARLLPMLEQAQLFNALNMSFISSSAQNQTVYYSKVNVFNCPSDGNVPSAVTGATNYPNNLGIMRQSSIVIDGPADKMNQSTDGPDITFASVSDGLSNTAIFSEWIKGKNLGNSQPGVWTNYNMSIGEPTGYSFAQFISTAQSCQKTTDLTGADDQKGAAWLIHIIGRGGGYTHLQTPQPEVVLLQRWHQLIDRPRRRGNEFQHHPGGVNVLFLDGSVKFIKNTINQMTWWAIATRANGEVISADQL